MKNSHSLAAALREVAAKLEANESFELGTTTTLGLHYFHKSGFFEAVKCFGGEKQPDNYFFELNSVTGPLTVTLSIARDSVCRKVTKLVPQEVWECDSILEQSQQGGAR